MINRFYYYFTHPRILFSRLLYKVSWAFPNERKYLECLYFIKTGKKLNLNSPKSYNEKLQWLKLYNRRPEYHKMVEKYDAKQWVTSVIGKDYIIPTYGLWNKVEEIEWDKLPKQFVIKNTNCGGGFGVFICKDKESFDIKTASIQLKKGMQIDLYKGNCEWPYKDIPHRIIAEAYIEEGEGKDLHDYKVMCFDGQPKLIEYHSDRHSNRHKQDFYDINWKKTDITQGGYGEYSTMSDPKPECFEKMLELSSKLSKGIPHCRVDWYIAKGKLYFGEITFFDGSGFVPWDRKEDELLLGSWINLPEKKELG